MIGQKLGSFTIESKIGSGAMGVVYRGVHEKSGRQAAIKVVTAELSQKGRSFERFKREAEILKQFRHPNIVRLLAEGRSQGTAYFAMEFIAGETLDKVLEDRGFLPWEEVVTLGIQLCDALHYAHQRGVVHRDIKPSNLMLSDKGHIKLTDFGIAKDLDATALTATGRTLGTAAYMAPEQIRGTPEVSHKTDLYALGIVLYQMLTGEVPFQGPTAVVMMHRHLTDPPPRPSTKLTEIPRELDDLVFRLMAKEPNDRPWDAAAAGMVLTEIRDKLARGEPVEMVWPGMTADGTGRMTSVRKVRKKSKGARDSRRSMWETGWFQTSLLGLALVAVVGVIAYLLWPPSADYLYRKAAALMASKEPDDWATAQKDYLDDLDSRYPTHPYRKQTQAWRDQIMLHRVLRRANILDKTNLGSISQPANEPERLYASVSKETAELSKIGRDGEAARRWREMAGLLKEKNPEERPWALLARERAEVLEKAIAERRERVLQDLTSADIAQRDGRLDEALRLRVGVLDRFASYHDLDDLIAVARGALPAPQAEEHAESHPDSEHAATATPPAPRSEGPPDRLEF